jgi:uncharacterized membrane protein YgcG
VLLYSTGEKSPKEFVSELFQNWEIGKKAKDRGLVLLVVKDRRRVEVELGSGLKALLPSSRVSQILHNEVIQNIKEGRLGLGLINGVRALARTIEASSFESSQSSSFEEKIGMERFLIIFSVPLILVISMAARILWLVINKKKVPQRSENIKIALLGLGLPAILVSSVLVALVFMSYFLAAYVFLAGGVVLLGLRYLAYRFG